VSNPPEDKRASRDDAVLAGFFARAEEDVIPAHPDYDPDEGLQQFLEQLGERQSTASPRLSRLPDPPPADLRPASVPQPSLASPRPESGLPDMVAAISATNPAARLELRRNPVILVVILSDLLVRSLVIVTNHAAATNRAIDSNRAVADILASTLARTFNDHSDDDFRQAYARASDYASILARVFSDTHKMASYHARDLDFARDLARASDLARDHARDLERDPDHPLTALARARDLFTSYDFATMRNLAHSVARARGLNLARDLDRHIAVAVGRILGVRHVKGLAAALLDGALDDFTHADLAQINLTDFDLTGVRWSVSGTKWPRGIDIDVLRAQSREVPPRTGVYVIVNPGDVETRQDAHV
jgi:hypothetical protein